MKFLIVVAHPDDEVLGAGASIYKWIKNGHSVDVCIMSSEAKARQFRPEDKELQNNTDESLRYLGVNNIYRADFPNIEMNTVPHLHLVQFIEKTLQVSAPDIVITHHSSDTNNDHVQTSKACQAAVRLFQRRTDMKRIKEVLYMEVPSSTEWNIDNPSDAFHPNCFVEIGVDGVRAKSEALAKYRGVMRAYPHPRSEEYLKSLACMRGSQWGLEYAEAFQVAIREF